MLKRAGYATACVGKWGRMSYLHTPIVRTPDSEPGEDRKRLGADNGELLDMRNAPFAERLADNEEARERFQAVLKELNPAGGKSAPEKPFGKKRKEERCERSAT